MVKKRLEEENLNYPFPRKNITHLWTKERGKKRYL